MSQSGLQRRIHKVLALLVGLPLSDMWRAGFQIFEFGEQQPFQNRKGKEVTKADYALHVSCPWRIVGPKGLSLASDDYISGKASGPRHGRAKAFFADLRAATLVVERLEADVAGSVRLWLRGGYLLELLPMSTSRSKEHWRLLPPNGEGRHFVDRGSGVEA